MPLKDTVSLLDSLPTDTLLVTAARREQPSEWVLQTTL